MSVDHTKVVYYSGFNAYKNEGVFDTTVEVTSVSIAAGAYQEFTRTITVDSDSDYVTVAIQANESTGFGPATPTALRWQQYPAAQVVSVALSTDPSGAGQHDCYFSIKKNGTQVTFVLSAFNPYGGAMAFTATSVGVRYVIYTTEE